MEREERSKEEKGEEEMGEKARREMFLRGLERVSSPQNRYEQICHRPLGSKAESIGQINNACLTNTAWVFRH